MSALLTDPGHESPDVIDTRANADPTRRQSGGSVPVGITPGAPQPVIEDASDVPILAGWNVWDVYQSQTPIAPLAGSLDEQLAAWVRGAANLAPSVQIALVANTAAGALLKQRSSIPALSGPLGLGTTGSAVAKRTIAFNNPLGRMARPWPHDMNTILDAVYVPASAPPAADPDHGVITLPEMTITGTAPSSSGFGEALFVAACAVGGFFLVRAFLR